MSVKRGAVACCGGVVEHDRMLLMIAILCNQNTHICVIESADRLHRRDVSRLWLLLQNSLQPFSISATSCAKDAAVRKNWLRSQLIFKRDMTSDVVVRWLRPEQWFFFYCCFYLFYESASLFVLSCYHPSTVKCFYTFFFFLPIFKVISSASTSPPVAAICVRR